MMIEKLLSGNRTILIQNLEQLKRFAIYLRENVSPGDFIALTGTLGAGKTTFAQLFCEAAGIEEKVTSPTYTLLNEYCTHALMILHGDIYRLTEGEIERSLPELEEQFSRNNCVVLLEWADKAPQLSYLWTWHLDFSHSPVSDTARHITLSVKDPSLLANLEEVLSYGA